MRQKEGTNRLTVRRGARALAFIVLAAAFWLAPGAAVSPSYAQSPTQTPRNIVLFYDDYPTRGDPEFQVTQKIARPLVAHLDQNGKPTDWMFDSFIFFSLSLLFAFQPAQPQAYIDSWTDYLFDGNQIANLDATVAEVKVALGQPDYRMNVFLSAPVAFNATDSSVPLENVESSMLSNLDTLLARWNTLNPPNLKLVGFYWGYSEDLLGYSNNRGYYRAVDQLVKDAAVYVHSKSLVLLMIPYVAAVGYERLHTLGVDYVTMQPNYAFDQRSDLSAFPFVNEEILAGYVDGAEFEVPIDWVDCCGGDWRTNFNTYIEQAAVYNWRDRIATYYHGSAISAMSRSSNSDYRTAYDKLYEYIRPAAPSPPTQTVTFYTDPNMGAMKTDDVVKTDGATENYASGTRVHVVANPPTGYSFAKWETSGVSVDNALSQDTYMVVSDSGWLKAHFEATEYTITVLARKTDGIVLGGVQVSFGSENKTADPSGSVQFSVSAGTYSLSLQSSVSGGSGVQYVFAQWSDGDVANTKTVNVGSSVTYDAIYKTQYQLTISTSPSIGGSISPAVGSYWYDLGQTVSIQASPTSGYTFGSWTGSGSGSYTGSANPASITMNGPVNETASLASTTQLPIIAGKIVSVSDSPDPVTRGQSVAFTVKIKNIGNVVWSGAIITIKIYNPDGTLYATPTLNVGNIRPGVAYTYNISWKAPTDVPRGIWRYEVYLNYGNIPIGRSTSPSNTITVK